MFTIYDTEGQRFRGTLEKLTDVPRVTHSHHSRAENRDDQRAPVQDPHQDDPHQRQQAEAAYKEAIRKAEHQEEDERIAALP